MVSIVLLILAPVLVLAAVVVGGIALFTPSGSTKPTPKVTPTLAPTPPIPISKVIFTSQILPENGKEAPTFHLPSNVVTAKYIHPLVDKIPSSSLSSAVVTTTTTSRAAVVTTTSKVPKVITITRVPEVVTTTSKVPEAITTSKISEALTTKVVTTTSKIPEAITTKVVTTTSKVPEAITTPKIPEVVTTKSVASPPSSTVATATAIAKMIPAPAPALAPIPAVSSDAHTNEKSKGSKENKKDDKSNEEEDDDDEEDWEEDDSEREEEEDESPSISGTTGIQAMDASDSRHVETVQYYTGSKGNSRKKRMAVRMKQPVVVKQDDDAQAESVSKNNSNKDDGSNKESAIVDELQKQIDEIVKEQSSPFEAELSRIMTDLLDGQDAMEYQDVLDRIGTAQQQKDASSTANDNREKDAITQTTFRAQDDATPTPGSGGGGFNPHALLNTLLQPFIIQFRTDVRNTVIFICGGQHDGLIDGTIHGNDDYAKKAAQDDIVATTHPDGVHLMDLFDPNTAALALDCLRTHFGHLTTALGKLLMVRFAAAKEFLLNQIAGLAGIPRFLIPFSEEEKEAVIIAGDTDEEGGEQFANQSVDALSEAEKEEIERSGAFAQWLVDSMVNEFRLAVEQDQDLFGGARSNIAAVANLPDTEGKAQVEDMEDEEISRPSTATGAVPGARDPSQPRIRSRRSTNKI